MILFTSHISTRLSYMAHWLGLNLFGTPLVVCTEAQQLQPGDLVFNYSNIELGLPAFCMVPTGLLFESSVRPLEPPLIQGSNWPIFFPSPGPMGFDLLSAAFFLISRYEEYLPHSSDLYGRYAHENSLAYRKGFLNRPIVDEWMAVLKKKLLVVFPEIKFLEPRFKFQPSFDLDIAWSYQQKGWVRNLAGLAKDVLAAKWPAGRQRLQTLLKAAQDPFDVFNDLEQLHLQHGLKPIYFYLMAKKKQAFDKNILPNKPAYIHLIQKLTANNNSGLHASWQSFQKPALLKSEGECFTKITGLPVFDQRFHYLKFNLPQTYHNLLQQLPALQREWSMGYGTINGYRASTCNPFYWYDLENEQPTRLQIVPFAFMEANSIFEEKQQPVESLQSLQLYHDQVKNLNGTLVTIFHNHLISYNADGRLWWNMYRLFLEQNF